MLIGFLGDVHGQVFHALVLLLTWQARMGRRFDFIVQVGDMGAEPDGDLAERPPYDLFGGDFAHLLKASGPRAARLRRVRKALGCPIHFLRGNHEDFAWLRRCLDALGYVNSDSGDVVSMAFDLAGVEPDAYVDAEVSKLIANGRRAADAAAGSVERRQEPVAGRLDLASAESVELGANQAVMCCEQVPPTAIARPCERLGRADDVGEHHCGEHPVDDVTWQASG